MNDNLNSFLGNGWKFPIEFETASASVTMLNGEDDISNSLDILFATHMGERIMHPDFGSELESFLFTGMTRGVITYIQEVVHNAILFNEPRIIVNEVEIDTVDDDPSRVDITIKYTVSATNNRYNYVYPFYIREATNLEKY